MFLKKKVRSKLDPTVIIHLHFKFINQISKDGVTLYITMGLYFQENMGLEGCVHVLIFTYLECIIKNMPFGQSYSGSLSLFWYDVPSLKMYEIGILFIL